MDDAIKAARKRKQTKEDTIPPVEAIKEEAMTEPTPVEVIEVQNPDMVLWDEYKAAEATIKKWNDRVEELKAVIRKRDAQFTPDQMAQVRVKIDDWMKARYPAKVVYRAIRTEIDMDGWSPAGSGDNVHIHPTIEAFVKQKMVGGVNTPSMRELYQSAFDYVADARDEDGGQILSSFDLDHLKSNLGLVAPQQAVRSKNQGPQGVAGPKKTRNTTGNMAAKAVWPGTNVGFTVSYTASTNNYTVWGGGRGPLIKKLAAVGVSVTEADIQAWVDANHQHLSFS